MKNKILFSLLGLFLGLSNGSAQNFSSSQYSAMPGLLNAAATGQISKGASRWAVNYRDHWNLPSPETEGQHGFAVGFDHKICLEDGLYLGLGGLGAYDDVLGGGIRNAQLRGMSALHIRLAKLVWMSAGASLGVFNYGINPEKLTFNEQYNQDLGDFDPDASSRETFFQESRWNGNFDAGLMLYNGEPIGTNGAKGKFWAFGIALLDIIGAKYTLLPPGTDRTPNRYSMGIALHGKYQIDRLGMINVLFRKQSLTESKQWLGMLGVAWQTPFARETPLFFGLQGKFSGREKGLGSPFALTALSPFGEIHLGGHLFRFSWDIELTHIGNTPPNGFEISWSSSLGKGACPMYCHF